MSSSNELTRNFNFFEKNLFLKTICIIEYKLSKNLQSYFGNCTLPFVNISIY